MKKKITLFLAVVSFLSLTGCDKSQEQTNETETAKEHITFETETLNTFMVSHDILLQHQTHHRKIPKYSIGQSRPNRKITDTN